MPFLAKEHYPIPNKDLLSYYFDEPQFDQDEPLYIDAVTPSRCFTANQARQTIRQLAAGFKAAGLRKGDCVCIHSFNDIDYPILVNGILGFGGIFAGTNPAYKPNEILHHLKTSEARILIAETELLDGVLGAAREAGISADRIFAFDHHPGEIIPPGIKSWKTLVGHGESDWPRFDDYETARTTEAVRLYSSGTTGLPKPGSITHHNLIAQHVLTSEWNQRPWRMRRLVCLPMFHAATAPCTHFAPLHSGQITYVMRRFELEPFLRYTDLYQITDHMVVPPMAIALIMSPISKNYSLRSIRSVQLGAAPLDAHSQSRLKALMSPETTVTQVLGMTETSCLCSMFRWDEHDLTGSVGRFLPGMDVKLVDDDGREVTGYDVRGELCLRGPLVFQGYLSNNKVTDVGFDADGFFHGGDVAYCDGKTGLWYIVDRKKEFIKVRGFQVAPPEIEAVLLSHPQVVDTAVIGVPAFTTGSDGSVASGSESPRAYVVRRPGTAAAPNTLDEAQVKAWVAERLARFKNVDGGVVFVDAIPKTPSGKILKRLLRERAKEEMSGPVKARI